ncbi:unnamed protein product [Toxocara canis]|uniref:Serpentine receptor class gamma n=1 Tax=Toxocara canis TaxID=6265 RepID=A0A183UPY7_TOXCA|nr:unnamed protein product [Toxocara canis]
MEKLRHSTIMFFCFALFDLIVNVASISLYRRTRKTTHFSHIERNLFIATLWMFSITLLFAIFLMCYQLAFFGNLQSLQPFLQASSAFIVDGYMLSDTWILIFVSRDVRAELSQTLFGKSANDADQAHAFASGTQKYEPYRQTDRLGVQQVTGESEMTIPRVEVAYKLALYMFTVPSIVLYCLILRVLVAKRNEPLFRHPFFRFSTLIAALDCAHLMLFNIFIRLPSMGFLETYYRSMPHSLVRFYVVTSTHLTIARMIGGVLKTKLRDSTLMFLIYSLVCLIINLSALILYRHRSQRFWGSSRIELNLLLITIAIFAITTLLALFQFLFYISTYGPERFRFMATMMKGSAAWLLDLYFVANGWILVIGSRELRALLFIKNLTAYRQIVKGGDEGFDVTLRPSRTMNNLILGDLLEKNLGCYTSALSENAPLRISDILIPTAGSDRDSRVFVDRSLHPKAHCESVINEALGWLNAFYEQFNIAESRTLYGDFIVYCRPRPVVQFGGRF